MLLKNVELSWTKLDPKNPDTGYQGKALQYSVVATVSDAAVAKAYTDQGVKFAPVLDKATGEPTGKFKANLKKKIWKNEDGTQTPPPVLVDGKKQPFTEFNKIGNGTVANVQVRFKDYNVAGNSGTSVILVAIQIVKLKEFSSETALEFDTVDVDSGDLM